MNQKFTGFICERVQNSWGNEIQLSQLQNWLLVRESQSTPAADGIRGFRSRGRASTLAEECEGQSHKIPRDHSILLLSTLNLTSRLHTCPLTDLWVENYYYKIGSKLQNNTVFAVICRGRKTWLKHSTGLWSRKSYQVSKKGKKISLSNCICTTCFFT